MQYIFLIWWIVTDNLVPRYKVRGNAQQKTRIVGREKVRVNYIYAQCAALIRIYMTPPNIGHLVHKRLLTDNGYFSELKWIDGPTARIFANMSDGAY